MNDQKLRQMFPDCLININGTISPPESAKISIFDRGFLYGDSIYEVTYSEDRCLLFFEDHLDRLFNSARLLDFHLFINRDTILTETLKTLAESDLPRAYVRIIITRGETPIGLDPSLSTENNLIIIVKPQPPWPEKLYQEGLYLTIASVLRNDIKSTNPNAKSGNYLNNVMAINEAKKMGADDAIMVNHEGKITEGTTFNIWMVKDGKVSTPKAESGLLKGITRKKILQICHDNNISCEEGIITPDDILNADEVFITSATKGVMPVSRLNNKVYLHGRINSLMTSKLSSLYNDFVNQYKQQKSYTY